MIADVRAFAGGNDFCDDVCLLGMEVAESLAAVKRRTETKTRHEKIAVVEDNPDNRLLVQVILEPLYEVVEYETGFAALEGLPKEKPDLVLLDISLRKWMVARCCAGCAPTAIADAAGNCAHRHAMAGDRGEISGGGLQRLCHQADRG